MKKQAYRAIAAVVAVVMLLSSIPLHAIAAVVAAPKTTSIQNEFVKATVDNATGRFSVRTVDGQPIRKKDNGTELTFGGDNPESSFTTFKIDGIDFIFGNPYKLAPEWFSEVSAPESVRNADGTESLITVWTIKGIRISQAITLILGDDLENAGNARIAYKVDNTTKSTVEVGTRVLLDTSVGGNDGPAFQIGQNYRQPLTVERKLVHEPEKLGYDIEKDEQAYNLHKLPAYWVMRDKLDLSNPLATNVIAYGFNNLFEGGIHIVDEMIVGHWSGLAATKWAYEPNENLDFTTDTNAYGTADTAVAYYWQPGAIKAGESQTFEVVYGLGEIVAPDKVFDIRYLDPVQKLETNADETGYVGAGIFEINAEIENLAMFDMEHSKIKVTISLENGLSFVDENGKELGARSQTMEFRKEIPPEEAAQGIEVIPYKPGETIAAKWRVKASGKPWPTTRQYLVTVSSPETEAKLEDKAAEAGQEQEAEIRAIYESSKSNFVFLPPVGELRPTILYGMTPKETFYKDDKLISLNVSNIAAYDPGNQETGAAANFDLYLVNVKNGDRYKVPVSQSVKTQPLGNGFAGDMRIAFRGGDKVDADGLPIGTVNAQELPLGEYAVSVDFKDKSVPDVAEALSFTTTQTFQVGQNEETRVRKAGVLAVYKMLLDLTGSPDKAHFAEALPADYGGLGDGEFTSKLASDKAVLSAASKAIAAAAKRINPKLSLDKAVDMAAVPVYGVKAFATEAEFAAFAASLQAEDEGQEIVLEVRGNIVLSGEGENAQYTVNTDTEPAIINKSVAYKGKDLTFPAGDFALASRIGVSTDTPFLHALYASGDGTLSVANSGFVFHKGEWTIDFYNGFDKTLGTGLKDESPEQEEWEQARNPQDDSVNGNLSWANGLIGDAINPYQNLLVSDVYFNKHTLFATPSFSVSGFGLQLSDFILRQDGVSFGGAVKLYIVDGEVKNVMFNQSGFVGIDASLKFKLDKSIGLFKPDGDDSIGGGINITHFKDPNKYGVENTYGIEFEAKLENIMSINAELAFKQVADGRILPDVIAFGSDLPDPGVAVGVATYITAIRGAIRELANTIAGGQRNVPLTLEAGIDMKMGVKPAVFSGAVDLTLKTTGFKVAGSLGLGEGDDVLKMLTEALVQTQWVTPMFLTARATVDIGGWDIIVGKASLFIGQNLEKHRTDFEGMISSKIQVPSSVPVVGGIGFGVRAGANNDKVWAGITLLFVTLGITYYWGGGIEFGTNGSVEDKDALMYLLVQDPELGPRVMAIGNGASVVATSWQNEEPDRQEVKYTAVGEGVDIIDDGSQNIGVGGITTSNGSKIHSIPMDKVTGDALLEIEYFETKRPKLTFKRADGSSYDIVVGDVANPGATPNATAFEQIVKAVKEGDVKPDGTKATKQEALQSTDVRRLYVAVPADEAKTGRWTLTSDQQIRTKLLNLPVQPSLTDTSIKTQSDKDVFKASWTVKNASPGDTVSLYLSKDKLSEQPDPTVSVDPGLLIARDIAVKAGDIGPDGTASGEVTIDVRSVASLDGADIRGLLRQGDYYLRAELKTETAFSARTSADAFKLVDGLAPSAVGEVGLKAAGNGQFEVEFPQAVKKSGQEDAQYGYLVTALDDKGQLYEPFGEVMYTEDQLESSLQNGRYRLSVGGWTLVGKPKLDDKGALVRDANDNIVMENVQDRYTGLETGKTYSVGVTTVRVPNEQDGASDNMRFSETVYSGSKLLPKPSKPTLSIGSKPVANGRYDLTVAGGKHEIPLSADQAGVVVEAVDVDGGALGSVELTGTGRSGKLSLAGFDTDGTYAVELHARNKTTGDYGVTMLYLTVDTTAPMIYLDTPDSGYRIAGGKLALEGTTNTDAALTVTNADTDEVLAAFKPNEKGEFAKDVKVTSSSKTVALRIEAKDAAGNANSAVVEAFNDDLKLPKKLTLKLPAALVAGGSPVQLEAVVEYTDGSEEKADSSKLSFTVDMGDANVNLSEDGKLAGRKAGSALITAAYEPWEGLSISGTDVVAVAAAEGESAPTDMATIRAATAGTGKKGETRIIVTDKGHGGNMTGSELAYRVYADAKQVQLPVFEQDISSWSALPADGVIEAKDGDRVVVAKRTSDAPKLATAVSAPARAYVYESVAKPSGPDGSIVVGGVALDVGEGGANVKLPILLGGALTQGLIEADIKKTDGGLDILAKPVREALLAAIGNGGKTLSLPIKGNVKQLSFRLDADLVRLLQEKDVALDIETDTGRYTLPAGAVDLEALRKAYPASELKDIAITLSVAKPSDAELALAGKAGDSPGIALVGAPASFSLAAGAGGVTKPIERLAAFAPREIPLPAGMTEKDFTTAVVLEADGSLRQVPTKVSVREGQYFGQMSSMTNSLYAIVRGERKFPDTAGHWAAEAIGDLASRLIVSGGGDGTFKPGGPMTRAEFASILVKALGLTASADDRAAFADVSRQAWYYDAVRTAVGYGLIGGYGDGRFGPGDKITREQAMVILAKAMKLAGADAAPGAGEAAGLLGRFKDASQASAWAKEGIAATVSSGVIAGQTADKLAPKANMTRAELATAVRRMLQKANLIQ
ncbi:S-layer homology domain-containing protein [Cohnella sp. GCM10020058]|uniref:S-layer homology domain-containing protein n=1 Tax=Cohnella sp. GCM10020058 TaxID=3317330 RepID=UPI00363ACDAC